MATPTIEPRTITQLISDYADLINAITIRRVDRADTAGFAGHLEEAAEVLEGGLTEQTWEDADALTAAAAYLGDAIQCEGDERQVLLRYADQHLMRIDEADYL